MKKQWMINQVNLRTFIGIRDKVSLTKCMVSTNHNGSFSCSLQVSLHFRIWSYAGCYGGVSMGFGALLWNAWARDNAGDWSKHPLEPAIISVFNRGSIMKTNFKKILSLLWYLCTFEILTFLSQSHFVSLPSSYDIVFLWWCGSLSRLKRGICFV